MGGYWGFMISITAWWIRVEPKQTWFRSRRNSNDLLTKTKNLCSIKWMVIPHCQTLWLLGLVWSIREEMSNWPTLDHEATSCSGVGSTSGYSFSQGQYSMRKRYSKYKNGLPLERGNECQGFQNKTSSFSFCFFDK